MGERRTQRTVTVVENDLWLTCEEQRVLRNALNQFGQDCGPIDRATVEGILDKLEPLTIGPKVEVSLSPLGGIEDCPTCGDRFVAQERTPNGYRSCVRNHRWRPFPGGAGF